MKREVKDDELEQCEDVLYHVGLAPRSDKTDKAVEERVVKEIEKNQGGSLATEGRDSEARRGFGWGPSNSCRDSKTLSMSQLFLCWILLSPNLLNPLTQKHHHQPPLLIPPPLRLQLCPLHHLQNQLQKQIGHWSEFKWKVYENTNALVVVSQYAIGSPRRGT